MEIIDLAAGPVEIPRMIKALQAPEDLRWRPSHQHPNLRRRQKPVPGDLPEDFKIACHQFEGSDCLAVAPEAGKSFS